MLVQNDGVPILKRMDTQMQEVLRKLTIEKVNADLESSSNAYEE